MRTTQKHNVKKGERFNSLIVIEDQVNNYILCQCDCGTIKKIAVRYLINNRTRSCGCLSKKRIKNLNLSHQLCSSKLYKIFHGMKKRCYNIKKDTYKYYGGRGIKICDEWLSDFMNFYNWAIANGYQDDLSIERIDVNGNYCPENCCWIPFSEQGKNTTKTRYIVAFGETKILADWIRDPRCEVNSTTFFKRLSNNEDPEIAMKKRTKVKC